MIGKDHIGLNQSKGILYDKDPDLDGIPEEETKSELESQGVVSVTDTNIYLCDLWHANVADKYQSGVVSDEN